MTREVLRLAGGGVDLTISEWGGTSRGARSSGALPQYSIDHHFHTPHRLRLLSREDASAWMQYFGLVPHKTNVCCVWKVCVCVWCKGGANGRCAPFVVCCTVDCRPSTTHQPNHCTSPNTPSEMLTSKSRIVVSVFEKLFSGLF